MVDMQETVRLEQDRNATEATNLMYNLLRSTFKLDHANNTTGITMYVDHDNNNASGIRHPASGIRHPASGIRHPASVTV